ncbi:4'-phosphopantetheinyl transferase superfamily protein, partial [Rhizobiaceae sp. 2RAB30]
RPFIDPDLGIADLHFSLSHTHGLVVCAIGAIEEIGVDVERRDRDVGLDELAPGVLASAELKQFKELPPEARPEFFFTLWTFKEAYVKARGMGLTLNMKDVCLDCSTSSPRVSFSGPIDDDALRWRFHSLRPTEGHIVGIAATPPAGTLEVSLRQARVVDLAKRNRSTPQPDRI